MTLHHLELSCSLFVSLLFVENISNSSLCQNIINNLNFASSTALLCVYFEEGCVEAVECLKSQ